VCSRTEVWEADAGIPHGLHACTWVFGDGGMHERLLGLAHCFAKQDATYRHPLL